MKDVQSTPLITAIIATSSSVYFIRIDREVSLLVAPTGAMAV